MTEPGGAFYDGDLGPHVPTGWTEALNRRRLLVVLVASELPPDPTGEPVPSLEQARRAGNIVAAQIPLLQHR